MKKVILISFLLLAVAFGTSSDATFNTILAEVQEDEFGRAIGSLVQMQMASLAPSGKLDAINKLLEDLQATLETQNENAKNAIENKRAYCTEMKTTYQNQIDKQKANQDDNKSELKDINDEQQTKKQDLLSEKANVESQRADLEQANSDLESENKQYQDHHASFEEAIKACEEALKLLNRVVVEATTKPKQKGAMFVQIGQKFEGIRDILEKHVKKGSSTTAFIQPIIDVLMDLGNSSSIDLEKVSQIMGLIKTLIQRLKEGLRDREISHNKTIDDLNKLVAHLKSSVNTAQTNIEILDQRLKEIQARQEELTKLIKQIDGVMELTQKTLTTLKQDCVDSEATYASEQSRRESSIQKLTKLIDYFHSKVEGAVRNVGF